MTIIPAYLRKGDTIGVICPAGFMPFEKAVTCLEVLQQWGFKIKMGKTLGHQFHYFSGTDEERLLDLQTMLDDDDVKAVLCARGGYGLTRIVDRVELNKFRKNPKWIIGFSDVTVLHAHILNETRVATLHAPMAAAFNDGEHENEYVQSLREALIGKAANYITAPHEYNNNGKVSAPVVGGNLSLIIHQLGTPSDFAMKGNILFIEDVGEYIYNVDRMLYQLKRAGRLKELGGLIIGGFTDMKDTLVPFGKDVYEVIHEVIKEYNYPIAFNFPISHEKENYAIKVGVEYTLSVSNEEVRLIENR